jgi:DNA polymerase-3 subunit gamma/tau
VSYLVLARKHRPVNLGEVVGQEHVTKTLAGALASGRLAHAFCFTGPRGVGKTSVARILAKALNCESGPTAEPCGQCHHCQEIDDGRAVDVQEIDAASNSRVEDVRELREVIRYRPQAARFRVTILDEVHMLSKAAFNALLKTLEEPPEHAVFILATTDVHKVPLTILSRCQRYDFRRLPPKTLAAHLAKVLETEGCRLPKESLALMAREADGSVRDSLSLLDQVLSLGRDELSHQEVVELLGLVDRELVAQTAEAVLAGDAGRTLDLVEQVYGAGGEMQAFYAALQEQFRNLAAAQAAPPDVELFGLSQEEIEELRRAAADVSPETLHEIFDHLARAEEMFRRASQPRLVMEMTLLKLTQVKPVLNLEQIIEALQGNFPEGLTSPAPPREAPSGPGQAPPQAGGSQPQNGPGIVSARPEDFSAAPAPVAPPAAGSQRSMPAPEQALKELAGYVGKSGQAQLSSYLGRAQVKKGQGSLVVTLPASPIARGLCTPDNQDKLCGLMRELWSDACPITLQAGAEEPEPQPADAEDLAAVSSLAEHPAVQEAAEVFEAQVVALNPTPSAK